MIAAALGALRIGIALFAGGECLQFEDITETHKSEIGMPLFAKSVEIFDLPIDVYCASPSSDFSKLLRRKLSVEPNVESHWPTGRDNGCRLAKAWGRPGQRSDQGVRLSVDAPPRHDIAGWGLPKILEIAHCPEAVFCFIVFQDAALHKDISSKLSLRRKTAFNELPRNIESAYSVRKRNYYSNKLDWVFEELADSAIKRIICTAIICAGCLASGIAINSRDNSSRIRNAAVFSLFIMGFLTPVFPWWLYVLYLVGS